MTLNQPEHCSHSGDIVISSGDWDALCADCDTPMVWAARRDLVAAHQTIADQARVIADLRDDASALQESLDTAKTDYLAGLTSWKDRMEVLKQRQSSVWQEGFQAGEEDLLMPNQPKEPPAEVRAAAASIRVMFLALVEEGFTESQALIIVGQVVVASIEGNT